MFKKKFLLLKFITIFFISISVSNAELIKPSSKISPSEVVKIQLLGLQKNNDRFKDSGIEQTWNFAHPNNKEVTGPLYKFKRMIKSDNYQMMIDHLSHKLLRLEVVLAGLNLKS